MLHHLAGVTIQVANLVNYDCHPQADGNHQMNSSVKQQNYCTILAINVVRLTD